jgi:hypothetical protein
MSPVHMPLLAHCQCGIIKVTPELLSYASICVRLFLVLFLTLDPMASVFGNLVWFCNVIWWLDSFIGYDKPLHEHQDR